MQREYRCIKNDPGKTRAIGLGGRLGLNPAKELSDRFGVVDGGEWETETLLSAHSFDNAQEPAVFCVNAGAR